MNKNLLFILFFSIVYTQASGFAAFGLGAQVRNTNPASIGLGGGTFFSGNSKNISSSSISSLWRSSFTRFTVHSGLNSLTINSLPDQFQHSLTYFSFLFPIGNKRVVGFGFQPVYRTNKIDIEESLQFIGADQSITGNPLIYYNKYSIDGGMSELFIQYSQMLNSKISLGMQYSLLFGTQSFDDQLYTYDVAFDTLITSELLVEEILIAEDIYYIYGENSAKTFIEKLHQFSGSAFTFEGRYVLPKHEWAFRTTVNGGIYIDKQLSRVVQDSIFIDKSKYIVSSSISEISIGYQYLVLSNLGLTLEWQNKFAFRIPQEIAIFNIMPPEEKSINFGSYLRLNNPKIGYWNNINLRGGIYLKELNFSNNKLIDYGFTLGVGIEYLNQTKAFDVSICFGNKDSQIFKGESENYISLQIGITTGEKWFMKRRRK